MFMWMEVYQACRPFCDYVLCTAVSGRRAQNKRQLW